MPRLTEKLWRDDPAAAAQLLAQKLRDLPADDTPAQFMLEQYRELYMIGGEAIEDSRRTVDGGLQRLRRGDRALLQAYRRDVYRASDALRKVDQQFVNDAIPSLYMQGLRAGGGVDVKVTATDARVIRRMQMQSARELDRAHRSARQDVGRITRQVQSLRADGKPWSLGRPTAARLRGAHGQANWPLDSYGSLHMSARGQTVLNLGTISGAKRSGVKYLQVVDGQGCGWSKHRDGEAANGKIVTLDEARKYPIAHPHCQRRFLPSDGPRPGKKDKVTKKKVAAVAAASGAIGIVSLAATPSVQRKVLELSLKRYKPWIEFDENIKMFVNRANEVLTEGQIAAAQVRDQITATGESWVMGFTDQLPEWQNKILGVSSDTSRTKVGETLAKFDEFADVHRKLDLDDDTLAALIEFEDDKREQWRMLRIQETFAADIPKDFLKGFDKTKDIQDALGTRFSMPQIAGDFRARMEWLSNKWLRVYTTETNRFRFMKIPDLLDLSDKLGVDPTDDKGRVLKRAQLINRLRANGADKLGWMNRLTINPSGMARLGFHRDPLGRITPNFRLVPKGPLRFGTELSQPRKRTKSEVAKLMKKSGLNTFYTDAKGVKQEFTRLEMLARLGMSDEDVRVVTTRVKLLVPGPVNFEAKFKSIIPEDWRDLKVSEMANLNLQGLVAEFRLFSGLLTGNIAKRDDAITMLSNINLLRNNKLLNARIGHRASLEGVSDLSELSKDDVSKFLKVKQTLRVQPGDKLDMASRALRALGDRFSPLPDAMRERIRALNGGVFQVARVLQIKIDDAIEMVKSAERNFREVLGRAREIVDEAKDTFEGSVATMNPDGLFGRYASIRHNPDRPSPVLEEDLISIRDEVRAGTLPRSFHDDMVRAFNFMDDTFPRRRNQVRKIQFVDAAQDARFWDSETRDGWLMAYDPGRDVFLVSREVAETWDSLDMAEFAVIRDMPWFIPGSSTRMDSIIMHELGHHMHFQAGLTADDLKDLYSGILDDIPWLPGGLKNEGSWFFFEKNAGDIDAAMEEILTLALKSPEDKLRFVRKFGMYSGTNLQELMAELFREATTGSNPSPAARHVLEFYLEKFGAIPLGPGSVTPLR